MLPFVANYYEFVVKIDSRIGTVMLITRLQNSEPVHAATSAREWTNGESFIKKTLIQNVEKPEKIQSVEGRRTKP